MRSLCACLALAASASGLVTHHRNPVPNLATYGADGAKTGAGAPVDLRKNLGRPAAPVERPPRGLVTRLTAVTSALLPSRSADESEELEAATSVAV